MTPNETHPDSNPVSNYTYHILKMNYELIIHNKHKLPLIISYEELLLS